MGRLEFTRNRRNHIRKLSFFGSVLTLRFRPESDVDVLVDFDPDRIPSLHHTPTETQYVMALPSAAMDGRTQENIAASHCKVAYAVDRRRPSGARTHKFCTFPT